MYRPNYLSFLSMIMMTLVGCRTSPTKNQHVVLMIDTSASVSPRSFTAAVASAQTLFKRLHRGDRFCLIPILAESAESQGAILRFNLPDESRREPYDNDIARMGKAVARAFEDLRTHVLQKPVQKTDILGALGLAGEEFAMDGSDVQRVVILLSDLIEDDGRFNFMTAPELAKTGTAKRLAEVIATERPLKLRAKAYIGLLGSGDYDQLGPSRRRALTEFWSTLLTRYSAKPQIASDGPGLVERFLEGATCRSGRMILI